MENLNLEQFNPTVAELTTLAESYKGLTIAGIDDKEGYERVKKARLDLRDHRVAITKKGKELREDANAFIKKCREHELGLVAITEAVEADLQSKQDAVDEEIEREKRRALIPSRREQLATIEQGATDEFFISFGPEDWAAWFNEKRAEHLNRKEDQLRIERERIESDKRAEQEHKNAEARAAEDAKLAEQREKDRQAEIEKAKAEAVIEENARLARETTAKADREAKEQVELEGKKKYQTFLKKYEVTEGTVLDGLHKIIKTGNTFSVYKLIDSITL